MNETRGTIPMGTGCYIKYEKRGPVTCKLYVGQFGGGNLQDKADTKLWYSLVEGNPHVQQGSGETPDDAIKDSIKRTLEHIEQQKNGLTTLAKALKGGSLEVRHLLDKRELEAIFNTPEAMGALSDYHDSQCVQAEAMGYDNSAQYHEDRAKMFAKLQQEAETKRAEDA